MNIPIHLNSATLSQTNSALAIATSEALGLMHRSHHAFQRLIANSDLAIIVLPQVINEDLRGEAMLRETNPDAATAIRAMRDNFLATAGRVAVQTELLTAIQEDFIKTDWVAHEISQKPGREISARVAATAIHFRVPVLSGNGFFLRVAKKFPLPGGVYDLLQDTWIVEPTLH
jgi:hypothetical protein